MVEHDDLRAQYEAGESWQARSIELHHAGHFDQADACLDEAQSILRTRHVAPVAPYTFERESWEHHTPSSTERWFDEIGAINLLNYVRRQPSAPDGAQVFAEYYDMDVGTEHVQGQRAPEDRLRYLPDDFFTGKSVLDVGCNAGGMLHQLGGLLHWGVGVDYDVRMINAANRIASRDDDANLRFYTFDLEHESLDLLVDFMPEPCADVVLLLSVCAHVRNWRDVIARCARLGTAMVFESNGTEAEQLGQLRALHRAYDRVDEVAGRGAPGIGARRLYRCQEPKQ